MLDFDKRPKVSKEQQVMVVLSYLTMSKVKHFCMHSTPLCKRFYKLRGEERQRLVFRPNGVRGKESMREIRLPDLRPEIRFSHPFNAITAQHQYQ
ncbi:hypothetical protein CDAR_250851 [Caerostris darwini]|uniref:Uncharacterized protein n=1 Tax=Caerostris darwini TaxID=1538125 RepID=A0AAV4TJC3_9ARAC|nr:hypothetical protein CDAR_250851 [Caerostris darwini]